MVLKKVEGYGYCWDSGFGGFKKVEVERLMLGKSGRILRR